MFSYYFNILILKIIKKNKKNIILMYFLIKNTSHNLNTCNIERDFYPIVHVV
jgi:hypothetical protein